jgi:octaprenyl-diphosphate synthase
MNLPEIQKEVRDDIDKVNLLIGETLKSNVTLLNTINDYLFRSKGKQLRPLLAILSARACGDPTEITYKCAAVAEMIHTATLLHDDVADDAPERRGNETVQSRYSPASSVLTGDYWLAKALSVLVEANNIEVMGFYTRAVQDLAEGELFQMQKAVNLDTTLDDYLDIVSRKTSSLFIAAVAGGAYSSGASAAQIEAMHNYAYHLGVAFQIRDDIFDYMPSLDTGKKAGTDIREKKITLPLICALEASDTQERMKMLDDIKGYSPGDDSLVSRTFEFVRKYSGTSEAQEILVKHSGLAVSFLSVLPDSLFRRRLEDIAVYVGERVL